MKLILTLILIFQIHINVVRPECLKEDNIYYTGNDINTKVTEEVNDCANWCGKTQECKFWSFRNSNKQCWIKTSNSGRMSSNGIMSGTKECAIGCLKEDNIYYTGSNINTKITGEVSGCANWCGNTQGCKFWSFRNSNKQCWIKNSNSGKMSSNGIISGTKGCAKGCLKEDNIYYTGSNINTKITGQVSVCANWCGKIQGCKFWSFRNSNKQCWIKSSNSGRLKSKDIISGTKECAKECLKEDNIYYTGNDITTKITGQVSVCANWCGKTRGCKFWSFRNSNKQCWIKTSNSGRMSSNGIISGTKGCAKDDAEGKANENDAVSGKPNGNNLKIYAMRVKKYLLNKKGWCNGLYRASVNYQDGVCSTKYDSGAQIKNYIQCQKFCKMSTWCKFWTWTDTKNCCRNQKNVKITGFRNPRYVSGTRNACSKIVYTKETRMKQIMRKYRDNLKNKRARSGSAPASTSDQCNGRYEVGVKYENGTCVTYFDSGTKIKNYLQCQKFCKISASCQFWTWTDTKICCQSPRNVKTPGFRNPRYVSGSKNTCSRRKVANIYDRTKNGSTDFGARHGITGDKFSLSNSMLSRSRMDIGKNQSRKNSDENEARNDNDTGKQNDQDFMMAEAVQHKPGNSDDTGNLFKVKSSLLFRINSVFTLVKDQVASDKTSIQQSQRRIKLSEENIQAINEMYKNLKNSE